VSPGDTTIHIDGTGFVPNSQLISQSGQITISNISVASPTLISASVNLPPDASGEVLLAVQNPNPGAAASSPVSIIVKSEAVSYDAAVRFLRQATFGPTPSSIAEVQQIGFSAFIDEQFAEPISLYPWNELGAVHTPISSLACSMLYNAVNGPDQLRQRVSFALSQIIVASASGGKVNGYSFPTWENVLQTDALSTYPQLLTDALQSYALGVYLDNDYNMVTSAGQHASQNLGRELLQIFTIGPYKLNMDGSLQTDLNGVPIPSYSAEVIDGVSRAITGWEGASYIGPEGQHQGALPLIPTTWGHDKTAKQLLDGVISPPGQTAQQDLNTLVDNIVSDPNLAPFISRRLIQALVTSNPSPDYIERVARVFADDGTGVVGNLKAVVKAILLDPEARRGDTEQTSSSFGHVAEPFLFFTGILRATGVQIGNVGPQSSTWACPDDDKVIGQWLVKSGQLPLQAPSVFNFYQFNNMLPGLNLYAPEMQIMNASTVYARVNFLNDLLFGSSALSHDTIQDQQWYADAQASPDRLVAELSNFMMGRSLDSSTASTISAAVSSIPSNNPDLRVRQAIYLIAASGQYQTVE